MYFNHYKPDIMEDMHHMKRSNIAMLLVAGALVYLGAKASHKMMHPEQNNASKFMEKAADKTISTIKRIKFEDSGAILDRFSSEIDKATELASAKVRKVTGI